MSRRPKSNCLHCVTVTTFMYQHWLYRIVFVLDMMAIQSARRFEQFLYCIFPDFLFITTFIPSKGKQTVYLSGCQRPRHISNKHTQCLYILRVSLAVRFHMKQICCVGTWPIIRPRSNKSADPRCLLNFWRKQLSEIIRRFQIMTLRTLL
jgi:hypothetical protein